MKIVWTKAARDDLKAVRAYIARDSAYYATRVVQRIADGVKRLKKFPGWDSFLWSQTSVS